MATRLENLIQKIEQYVSGIFKMRVSSRTDGSDSRAVTPINARREGRIQTEEGISSGIKEVFVVKPEDVLDAIPNIDQLARISPVASSQAVVPYNSGSNNPLKDIRDWRNSELAYLKDIVYMQNRIYSVVSQMSGDLETHKANLKYAEEGVVDAIQDLSDDQESREKDKKKSKKPSELLSLLGLLGGKFGGVISSLFMRIPGMTALLGMVPTLKIIAKILGIIVGAPIRFAGRLLGRAGGAVFRSVARSRGGQAIGRGVDVVKTAGARVRDGAVAVGGKAVEAGKAAGRGVARAGLRGSSMLKTALKGGGRLFAPLAAGVSLLTMASDVSAANKIEDPTERAKAKGSAIGGGLGGTAGGIAGAAAGSIFGPIGIALGGAAGAWLGEKGGALIGEAMGEYAPQIKEHFSNTKKYITDAFDSGPIEGFKTIFKDLFDTKPVQEVKDFLASTFDFLFPHLAEIRKTISEAFDIGIVDAFKNLILRIFGADIGEALKDTLKRAWLNIVEGMRRAALRIPYIGKLFRNKGDDAREKIEKNNEKIVNLTARMSEKNISEKEKANIQKEIDSLKAENVKQQEIVKGTDYEKGLKELDERRLKRELKTEAEKKKNADHGRAQKKVEEDRIKEDLKRQVAEIDELRKTDPELAQKKYDALKPDLKRYGLIDRVEAPWNVKTADTNGSDTVVPKPIDNVADSIVPPAETAPVRRLEEKQRVENQRTADKAVAERVAAEATARSANGGNNAVNNNTSVYNTNIENHVDSLNASNRNVSNAEQWGGD